MNGGLDQNMASLYIVDPAKKVERENRTNRIKRDCHGMTGTPAYRVWNNIKQRCYNINDPNYDNYGGRGITVCNKWFNSFIEFYRDMGDPPKGMLIDRINNNGNYEPGNCRWATMLESCRNQRINRGHRGRNKKPIKFGTQYWWKTRGKELTHHV